MEVPCPAHQANTQEVIVPRRRDLLQRQHEEAPRKDGPDAVDEIVEAQRAVAHQRRIGPDLLRDDRQMTVEGLDDEFILAGVMMGERTARQPGPGRDVDRRRPGIALGQEEVERCLDEAGAGGESPLLLRARCLVRCGLHARRLPAVQKHSSMHVCIDTARRLGHPAPQHAARPMRGAAELIDWYRSRSCGLRDGRQ